MQEQAAHSVHLRPGAPDRWPWCRCGGGAGQLQMFDPGPELEMEWDWPELITGGLDRVGFWRRRTPTVFGDHRGVGPLVLAFDSNMLIFLHENLEKVGDAISVVSDFGPLEATMRVPELLREIIRLWWWRDVRVWVDHDVYMGDARRPIRADRLAARQRTLEQLAEDYFARGGTSASLPGCEWIDAETLDPTCHVHPFTEAVAARPPELPLRWPKSPLDRRIARAALRAGCHVLVTEDRDVLKSHPSLFERGMAVMRPYDLLITLREAGEMTACRSVDEPAPDLSALATFYGLRSPDDFADRVSATQTA